MKTRKLNKWLLLGYIATVFNPLPSGIAAGLAFLTEKKHKSHGIAMLVVSAILIIVEIIAPIYYAA